MIKHVILNKILRVPFPWMTTKEFSIIKDLIIQLKPRRCLEWGLGYSTMYFSLLIDKDGQWTAIDHDLGWVQKIERFYKIFHYILGYPLVNIHHIAANHMWFRGAHQDGNYEDFEDYLNYPKQLKPYDFIFIDGRARKECLKKALEVLGPKGIVVLHDANRKYYHEPFKLYKYQVLYTDIRKDAGGLWIGSTTLNLSTLKLPESYV
jgi:predicted O-methyltransferase YrrM